jgi:hypothetical protein
MNHMIAALKYCKTGPGCGAESIEAADDFCVTERLEASERACKELSPLISRI